MRVLGAIVIAIASLGVFLVGTADGSAAGGNHPQYLAVGDSVTFGRRASDPLETAYVPIVADYLATVLSPGNAPPMPAAANANWFRTMNTARLDDETSSDMISAGQLGEAVAILQQHNQNGSPMDDVGVVTISIGGNDFRALLQNPACVPAPTAACFPLVLQTLGAYQANLNTILGALRAAAGPDTVIAIMTYYNPLAGCVPPAVLPVATAALNGLNGIIAGVAPLHGVLVANVAAAGLGSGDFYGDCIHPNDSGYAKIAQTFIDTIGPALP